ncbi:unnamed protein product [Heligmosomoides polygyrus]|uniref:Transposase n=1 Tax=Heligmosomoides polygyrus TaxID=6339 RepID=A0A183FE59_HELPZ|nr:unnamed protein product [Heligmosomoides polygyrus]
METKMQRWTAGVTRPDRNGSATFCVERKTASVKFEVIGKRPRGGPKQLWCDAYDLKVAGVHPDLALDRERCRHDTRIADPATKRDRR